MFVIRQNGKNCSFSGKFGVLCFLEAPVLRFSLLPYHRRTFCIFGETVALLFGYRLEWLDGTPLTAGLYLLHKLRY